MECLCYVFILAVALLQPVHSLDCYSCHQTDDPHSCNTTISCTGNQVCYLDVQGGLYSMGCGDNQHCGGVGGPGLVGRNIKINPYLRHKVIERQANCLECCSTDSCNSDLCKHLKPSQCVDDESVDCAKMNTIFHVCRDKQQASLVCPKFCDLCTLVNGNWTQWATWSGCDVTCGKGIQTRIRSCTNPAPANGGRDCAGKRSETKICQKDTCPVHGGWSTWSEWGSCSISCGVGMQRRDRSCSKPYPSLSGDHCYGESRDDRICMPGACSDGGWSSWTSWASQCVDDESVDCAKMNTIFHVCRDKQQASLVCPKFCDLCTLVNGNWTQWATWSGCDVTCGKGIQTRIRSCTNPAPANGGRDCAGKRSETKICQKDTCPVHGGWSTWSEWGSCSISCGVGMQRRDRSCSKPYPSLSGDHCYGESRDDRICMPGACSDGGWSSWTSWGTCSQTCGGGMRSKTRTCTNPKPSLLGKQCEGTSVKDGLCYMQVCPDHKVAFTAYGVSGSSSVVFTQVIQNYGNGYDSSTGRFTCKVPGIYNFAVQISKRFGTSIDLVQCFIYRNTVQEIGAREDPYGSSADADKDGYSISISGTFHLNKNDYVYIGGCNGISAVFSGRLSSFTGFLVTPDD